MNCDCSEFLRTETGFLSGLFFPNVCESCWFSVVQGLLGVFLSVWGHTVFVFSFTYSFNKLYVRFF